MFCHLRVMFVRWSAEMAVSCRLLPTWIMHIVIDDIAIGMQALPLAQCQWQVSQWQALQLALSTCHMSTATCHCNLSIIIIMVLILFDFVSNYFNSVTQSESVSDSVWLNYHDLWNVTDNLTVITSLGRNCAVQHLTNLSHGSTIIGCIFCDYSFIMISLVDMNNEVFC